MKSTLRLVALDEHARRLGLYTGQTLADARAMIPALETVAEDSVADRTLLEDLADWAGTNEYEVLTNISARVPRVFVNE